MFPETPCGDATYSIAQLAEAFGVTLRALRFYEDRGLLTPRRDGQMRVYSEVDRKRLAWIVRGKRVGFSISEIKEMLELYDPAGDRTRQKQVTLEKCLARLEKLERQRDDLALTIRELRDFCHHLEEDIAASLSEPPSQENRYA